MNKKKAFWKSKTIWVNILIAISIILPELIDLGFHIPVKWIALITLIANLILRIITKGGLTMGDSEDTPPDN